MDSVSGIDGRGESETRLKLFNIKTFGLQVLVLAPTSLLRLLKGRVGCGTDVGVAGAVGSEGVEGRHADEEKGT